MSKLFDPYHLNLKKLYRIQIDSVRYLADDAVRLKYIPKLSNHYSQYVSARLAKLHPRTVTGKHLNNILSHVIMLPISLYIKIFRWLTPILLYSLQCEHTGHVTAMIRLTRILRPYTRYLSSEDQNTILNNAHRHLSYLKDDFIGMDPKPGVSRAAADAATDLSFIPYLKYAGKAGCFVLTDTVYKKIRLAQVIESTKSNLARQQAKYSSVSLKQCANQVRQSDPSGFSKYHDYIVAQIRCFYRHQR